MAKVIGFFVLALFLIVLIIMFMVLLRLAGPTTSVWLNVYNLLRRGGWKTFLTGFVEIVIFVAISWFVLAR